MMDADGIKGFKIVCMSDAHIPGRAREIPKRLMDEVKKFAPDKIWFLGDFTSVEVLKTLQSIAHVDAVKGNMDILEIPETLKFEINRINFGLIHGNQIDPRGDREQLQNMAKYLGVDVLVCGHTHVLDVFKGHKLIINPGSATGAPSGGGVRPPASMIFMEVHPRKIHLKVLKLTDKKVEWEAYNFEL